MDKQALDRRRLGLRGRRKNFPLKTAGLVSKAPEILQQFDNLRCPGRCQRVRVAGDNSADAQIWG